MKILIHGDRGAGKTMYADAIVNQLLGALGETGCAEAQAAGVLRYDTRDFYWGGAPRDCMIESVRCSRWSVFEIDSAAMDDFVEALAAAELCDQTFAGKNGVASLFDQVVFVSRETGVDKSEKTGCDSLKCPGRDELLAYQGFEQDGKQRINEALYALVPAGMTMGEFDELTCEVFYKIRAVWDKQMDSSRR